MPQRPLEPFPQRSIGNFGDQHDIICTRCHVCRDQFASSPLDESLYGRGTIHRFTNHSLYASVRIEAYV